MNTKMRMGLMVHGIAALPLLFALSSCGKNGDADDARQASKSAIALGDAVAPEGCLSIPSYLRQIRVLDPRLTALQATTKMTFTAKTPIRRNYEVLSSLGGFQYGDVSIYRLQQLQNVSQTGCESFTFTDADGAEKVYKVKEKAGDYLAGETDSGERLAYRWLSPTQLEVTTRFISYDVPCGSEKSPIFVEQTKVYDWSMAAPAELPRENRLAVDRALLERIAEATGRSVADFYAPGSDSVELAEKLRAIPAAAPRPELLTCTAVPSPPREPHDGDGGENPGNDDGNGGGSGEGTAPPPDSAPPPESTPPPTPHDGVGAS